MSPLQACAQHANSIATLVPLPIRSSYKAVCRPRRSAYRYCYRSPTFARDLTATATGTTTTTTTTTATTATTAFATTSPLDLHESAAPAHGFLAALHKRGALRAPDSGVCSPARLGKPYETAQPLIRGEAMFQAPQTLAAALELYHAARATAGNVEGGTIVFATV